jgi:hypothetical protein
MHDDIKSNFVITVGLDASATVSAAAHSSTVIDMSKYMSAQFVFNCPDFNTTATLDGKIQMSDDNSTWADEDGASGNDTAITQAAAGDEGEQVLNVVNPQKRYYKAVWTVGTTTLTGCAFEVAGPLLNVEPS